MEWCNGSYVSEIVRKLFFCSRTRGSFPIWWISKNLSDRRDRTNKGTKLGTCTAEHELLCVTARNKAQKIYQSQTVKGLVLLAKKSGLFLKDSEKLLMIGCMF